jgi:hypothetical protein
MRCMACGADMVLMSVAPDDTKPVVGFEHRTFMCAECHEVERRLTFAKPDEKVSAEAMMSPHTSPSTAPTLSVQARSDTTPGLFKRMIARLRIR